MQAARGASLNPSDPVHPGADRSRRRGTRSRSLALFATIALLGYALDLTTKTLAVSGLTGQPARHVIGSFVTLDLARNPGAAFSTGTSYTVALSCVAIGAACAVLWVARRLGSIGWALALGFLLAGILGNLTDRVFRAPGVLRGQVVDFVALPHWPIFNVADMCINVAAVLIVIQAVRGITVAGGRTKQAAGGGSTP
ncbi:MAG: signal peptidase II [Nocardioidaceae bacterium]